MPRNRQPRIMKNYRPTSRRNQGKTLKRLLDVRPERVNKWPNYILVRLLLLLLLLFTYTQNTSSQNNFMCVIWFE
jgi:hypothetical protein